MNGYLQDVKAWGRLFSILAVSPRAIWPQLLVVDTRGTPGAGNPRVS